MEDFSQRLQKCCKQGDLITSDLQHWFERPYPTVRSWLHLGYTPRPGPRAKEAEKRLKLLEKGIARQRGFPVPAALPDKERRQYIEKVRNDLANGGVSKGGAP